MAALGEQRELLGGVSMVAGWELGSACRCACTAHVLLPLCMLRPAHQPQASLPAIQYNLNCRAAYEVTLCPVSGPQSVCVTQRVSSTGRRRLLALSTATFNGCSADTT